MSLHLNNDQIDLLLRATSEGKEDDTVDRIDLENAKAHLEACESCKSGVQAQRQAMERLALLKQNPPGGASPLCPPDRAWIELAAGVEGENAMKLVDHAAECDHCGPLLRQARADFSEELSPEEESLIEGLKTSSPLWRETFASQLERGHRSRDENLRRQSGKSSWLMKIFSLRGLAYSVTILALVTATTWYALHFKIERSSVKLIADAYAERRTVEIRFEGVPFVPMEQVRGGDADQNRMSRPALLKAEAEIAKNLKYRPDDVNWLQASARASLLEGGVAGPEAAVTDLQKAQRLAPDDQQVSVDLASALLCRGQISDRPEDYGAAEELLGQVLASRPDNEVALFNHAIALEKLQLKAQAIDAWKAFLKSHPSSPWSVEAKQRLSLLQDEIRERDQKGERPLKSINEIAAVFSQERKEGLDEIDDRIEQYQDEAIHNWLPIYYGSPLARPTGRETLKSALFGIAALLKDRHGDLWLTDFLTSSRHSSKFRRAVELMSRSDRLVQTSDDAPIAKEASAAATLFRRTRSAAGELRSEFDLALVEQLQHRKRPCEDAASVLLTNTAGGRYAWIRAQADLESAICAEMSDAKAQHALEEGLQLAVIHRFPILVMRATMFESQLYWALGDQHRAWLLSTGGLRTFWTGSYPRLRGYNFLVSLDDLVAQHQQPFLEASILKEAVPMIDAEPRPAMAAFEHAHLGQVQLESGDSGGAEESFNKTQKLFGELSPGPRRDALMLETELGLAKVEFQRGGLTSALNSLQQIRSSITRLPDDRLNLDFFQTCGIVELRSNRMKDAEADLGSAIDLAEKGLRMAGSEDERWQWSHRNEDSYRAMVELKLRSDPGQALGYWEWYKGASLRGGNYRTDLNSTQDSTAAELKEMLNSSRANPRAVVISYFLLPGSADVWVWDSTGIHERSLSESGASLSSQVERFAELCSDPDSNIDELRVSGAVLYKELIEPIEPWIAGHDKIVFEPDGILKKLPFEVLARFPGSYLTDSFAVTISPGFAYLNMARGWAGISAASKVLVVGNPQVQGWSSLPDAEQEARSVAALFPKSLLLLNHGISNAKLIEAIEAADVFHFSGHAAANVSSAGLIVGPESPFDADQLERLSAGRTQLVVLSACRSSHGKTGLFDDEGSLALRLMSAHVPDVVASRWSVDSEATRILMTDFYRHLILGESVSASLRSTAQSIRARRRFSHPYYWAGFSVFGNN